MVCHVIYMLEMLICPQMFIVVGFLSLGNTLHIGKLHM